MSEQDQINLLEIAWNQGWMHRERYHEIEHPKGMDYEEINFYHFKKWLAKNKQSLIQAGFKV